MTDPTHSPTLLGTLPAVDDAPAAVAVPEQPAEVAVEAPVDVSEAPARPDHVPEKFWDGDAGSIRTDALLKSYLELEKRLGAGEPPASPDVDGTVARSIDVPETPDAYAIETSSELVSADPEINRRLHEAGFSQDQAQLVYRLAEEYLLPAVSEAYGEVLMQQEVGRLEQAFGGAETWRSTADQLQTWGQANLDDDVYETLASSFDGVMAMHAMMQAREPAVVHADAPSTPADETSLRRMMQDPRYWRDRDPAFIAEVTRGFERVFKD